MRLSSQEKEARMEAVQAFILSMKEESQTDPYTDSPQRKHET